MSTEELRRLYEIERQLRVEDPDFVGAFEDRHRGRDGGWMRSPVLAVLALLVVTTLIPLATAAGQPGLAALACLTVVGLGALALRGQRSRDRRRPRTATPLLSHRFVSEEDPSPRRW